MIAIKVPPLGESVVEATVGRWLKREGDAVASGEPVVELETDKINVEVVAPQAGVLVRRAKGEGDTVRVDQLLAEVDEAAQAARPAAPAAPAASAPTADRAPPARAADAAPAPATDAAAARAKSSPAVRRMAAETGIDLGRVPGTGRDGRVTKADVASYAESQSAGTAAAAAEPTAAAAPAVPAPAAPRRAPAAPPAPTTPGDDGARETREKMSTRRRRIAEHLVEAQRATAHLTTFNEADMSAVIALRERVRDRIEKEHGVKLTFVPFFVKAACLALKAQPVVNAQIDGDFIVYRHYVNMGIAVASDQGLVVPVVKDADEKGMIQLSREIAEVAKRARDGKLTMDDLTGGTFTITNGGVFGSLLSTPILNYPQSGILGLHKIQDRPMAVEGRVEIRPMMYLALSYDHRLVDGREAVLFLVRIKELIEDPASMLID